MPSLKANELAEAKEAAMRSGVSRLIYLIGRLLPGHAAVGDGY